MLGESCERRVPMVGARRESGVMANFERGAARDKGLGKNFSTQ
jgi:hypothetical protein